MWEEDDRRRRLWLLEAAGMAQASQTVLDVAGIAGELDVPEDTIRIDWEQLDALGLVLNGPDEGLPPMLLTAGRQFLANGGHAELGGRLVDSRGRRVSFEAVPRKGVRARRSADRSRTRPLRPGRRS